MTTPEEFERLGQGSPHFRTICPCGQPATEGTYLGTFCITCATAIVPTVCDFCTASGVAYLYPCQDFAMEPVNLVDVDHNSSGGWAACAPCHDLIEADQWALLLHRHQRSLVARRPGTAGRLGPLGVVTRRLWAQFREHRTGPAIPVGELGEGQHRTRRLHD